MRTLLSEPITQRLNRQPKHLFRVNSRAFGIQPFFAARVLPGETLTNIWMESRAVTDPILNPIIGWKQEYFFYYVKMTDLLLEAAKDMFIDPANTDLSATLGIAANDGAFYTAKGGVDWIKRATYRIVDTWFRDEGETVATAVQSNGVPIAQIRQNSWMDSLTDKDNMPEGGTIASATDMGDLDRLMDAFNQLRAMGIAKMTYEDWLRDNGISIPNKDEDKPERLWHISDFHYPTNTVDPATGVPASAVSWVVKQGMSKPKFVKEPGFVIGLTVTRPKVYYAGLAGAMLAHATRAWDWTPNYLRDMPETSLKFFAGDTGPLGDRTTAPDGYFVDMRDELLYGDQYLPSPPFAAVPVDVPAEHVLALPTGNTFNWKYVGDSQQKMFFRDTEDKYLIRQDGYVSLTVKGYEADFTQQNFAQA